MSWVDKSAAQREVSDFLNPKNGPGAFIVFGYRDDNTLMLQHNTKGALFWWCRSRVDANGCGVGGGVPALLSVLKDNEVQYALIRIGDVKDGSFRRAFAYGLLMS